MFVCVCVFVREREKERESLCVSEKERMCVHTAGGQVRVRRRVAPVRTSPVMAAATPALREGMCVRERNCV